MGRENLFEGAESPLKGIGPGAGIGVLGRINSGFGG